MESSSGMLKELPISRRFRESPISLIPENDTEPLRRIRVTASVVCACQVRTSSKSEEGERFWQRAFPRGEAAYSVSWFMILKGLFPKSRHLNYTIKNDIYYLFYYLFIYKILHNTGKKRIIEDKSLRKEEYYGG